MKKNPFLKSTEESTSKYSSLDFINDPSLLKKFFTLYKDSRGVYRTTSLFFEGKREANPDPALQPIFTLKDDDYTVSGVTYFSLKRIYFSYDHVPGFEYQFALDVFGSWDFWTRITKSSLRHEFQAWREELEIKIKAESIKAIFQTANSDSPQASTAARYLADRGYLEKGRPGRPSKEEVAREMKIEKQVQDTVLNDMERIGMKIIK